MSINEPSDFGVPPWSGWTVRGPADDLGSLLHRAAEFLDSVGANHAVRDVSLRREGDDAVVDVAFDHWRLPADLDHLLLAASTAAVRPQQTNGTGADD